MSGKWITTEQIRIYMESRKKGKSQKLAAAEMNFSERTARNIESRGFEPANRERNWKTRTDPFEDVWEKELVPLLEKHPKLEASTLLEYLQEKYEEHYPDAVLRSLQRRVKEWKALFGPEKEIIFRQKQPPGWQGISDFTHADKLEVTLRNEAFPHLLYHYRLPYSGWEFVQVILGGESFTALAEGLQNALWESGGVPETHRTDSLSAAYKNCSDKAKEEFTESYHELCHYYGMKPTRNNKGVSHENGSIESSHGHLKKKLAQSLMLRGSRNFETLEEYKVFVQQVVNKRNKRKGQAVIEERAFLQPLPERKTGSYTEERVQVTRSSTISVKKVTYSVPSRLIGMTLKIHLYDDRLECFVGGGHALNLIRLRKHKQCRQIDYRHIIGGLIRKPQAFRHYIYWGEMFPTFAFRQTWELLDQELDTREACREYVKILYEASKSDYEEKVSAYLEDTLTKSHLPTSEEVKALFKRHEIDIPPLKALSHNLADYDDLLDMKQGGHS